LKQILQIVDIHRHLLRVVELVVELAGLLAVAVAEIHLTGPMMVDPEPMVGWVEQKILDKNIYKKQ
jgi:hypothetical protein